MTISLSCPDREVERIQWMLALHKQLAAAKMGHEKMLLQRQIDRLVCEPYGLTEFVALANVMRLPRMPTPGGWVT